MAKQDMLEKFLNFKEIPIAISFRFPYSYQEPMNTGNLYLNWLKS